MSEATPRPWAKFYTMNSASIDPSGYAVGDGAFVLAEDNKTVLARFPTAEEGRRAFRAVNRDSLFEELVGLLSEARLRVFAGPHPLEDPTIKDQKLVEKIDALLSRVRALTEQEKT